MQSWEGAHPQSQLVRAPGCLFDCRAWGLGSGWGRREGTGAGFAQLLGDLSLQQQEADPSSMGGHFLEGCRGAWRRSLGDYQPLGPRLRWSLGTEGAPTHPLCSRGGGELSLEATGGGVCFRGSKMPSQHALYPTRLASAQDADCSPGRWLSPGGRPWVPSAHGVAGGYSRGEDVPLASWAELSPGVQGRVGGWRSSVLTGA